jgi:hypothetical protein
MRQIEAVALVWVVKKTTVSRGIKLDLRKKGKPFSLLAVSMAADLRPSISSYLPNPKAVCFLRWGRGLVNGRLFTSARLWRYAALIV